MCDKGILEMMPDDCKLEYCIVINKELQDYILNGVSNILGVPVGFYTPIPGNYPEDNPYKDRVILQDLSRTYTIGKKKYYDDICSFSLQQLPGCCGIIVSYYTTVHKRYQNKGVNTFLQTVKERIAKENGYTIMLASTVSTNDAENHILEKSNWKKVDKFKNKRTGNTVYIWTKFIGEK